MLYLMYGVKFLLSAERFGKESQMCYRVLLVDDEKRIRVGLSNFIDWKALGYAPPLLAADVEEARGILRAQKIDLLITDIRLPDGTGLELCESIRPEHPDMPVFLLSAYGDFEYAREAIQLGVKHYFTKPTDLQALSAALADAHSKLERQRLALEQQLSRDEQHARSQQFLLSRLWKDLANGVIQDDAELHSMLRDFRIDLPHSHFALIQLSTSPETEDRTVLLLQELLRNASCVPFSFQDMGRLYLLVNNPGELDLTGLLTDFLQDSSSGLQLRCSDSLPGLSSIPRCMIQLCQEPRLLGSPEHTPQPTVPSDREEKLYTLENALLEAIKSNRKIDAMLLLDELHQVYADLPPVIRCDILTLITLLIQQYTRRFGVTLSSLYGDDFSLSRTIQQLSTPAQMDLWLREHVSNIFRVIQENKSDYSQQVINSIQSYVSTHYAEEITLNSVSQVVHLSPYYVSKLFKKTTGENFIDYLTSVRIEKAMELLSSPGVRVYEVAEQVGYKSTKHFSQIFRAYTGKTPSEYRQINFTDDEATQ